MAEMWDAILEEAVQACDGNQAELALRHPERCGDRLNTLATQYLVAHPGDELGLRRILGHISNEILAVYVHLSQSAIAERMGGVSLSSGWLQAR